MFQKKPVMVAADYYARMQFEDSQSASGVLGAMLMFVGFVAAGIGWFLGAVKTESLILAVIITGGVMVLATSHRRYQIEIRRADNPERPYVEPVAEVIE